MTVILGWVGNYKRCDHCTLMQGTWGPQLLPVFLPLPIHHGLSSFAPPRGSCYVPSQSQSNGRSSFKLKSLETVSHTVFRSLKDDCLMCFVTETWSVLRYQSLTPILFEKVALRGLQPRRCRSFHLSALKLAFRSVAIVIAITEQYAPSPQFCSLDFYPQWPFPEWLFTWHMSSL